MLIDIDYPGLIDNGDGTFTLNEDIISNTPVKIILPGDLTINGSLLTQDSLISVTHLMVCGLLTVGRNLISPHYRLGVNGAMAVGGYAHLYSLAAYRSVHVGESLYLDKDSCVMVTLTVGGYLRSRASLDVRSDVVCGYGIDIKRNFICSGDVSAKQEINVGRHFLSNTRKE